MQRLNIDKVLKARGIKKIEASEKSGINYSYLSLASTGKQNISVEQLLKLANSLNIPIADFFENDEDMEMDQNNVLICPHCKKALKIVLTKG